MLEKCHELLSLFWRAAAQIAEVRWFSFQVLMEELAEEFQRLHDRLRALALALPDAACSAGLLTGRRGSPGQSLF